MYTVNKAKSTAEVTDGLECKQTRQQRHIRVTYLTTWTASTNACNTQSNFQARKSVWEIPTHRPAPPVIHQCEWPS